MSKTRGGVFVQGDFAHVMTENMFRKNGFEIVKTVKDAQVVVWTGGCDINPRIYGESVMYAYSVNKQRDAEDLAIIEAARSEGKFMVGLCRGAQLLNCVPNGGTLWQDADKHGSADHIMQDYVVDKKVRVNSLHHQMMRPGKGAVLVGAVYGLSDVRRAENFKSMGPQRDPEVLWYPQSRSLCVQFHPEFIHPCTTYFMELMERYYDGKTVINSQDLGAPVLTAPANDVPWYDDDANAIAASFAAEGKETEYVELEPDAIAEVVQEASAFCSEL